MKSALLYCMTHYGVPYGLLAFAIISYVFIATNPRRDNKPPEFDHIEPQDFD